MTITGYPIGPAVIACTRWIYISAECGTIYGAVRRSRRCTSSCRTSTRLPIGCRDLRDIAMAKDCMSSPSLLPSKLSNCSSSVSSPGVLGFALLLATLHRPFTVASGGPITDYFLVNRAGGCVYGLFRLLGSLNSRLDLRHITLRTSFPRGLTANRELQIIDAVLAVFEALHKELLLSRSEIWRSKMPASISLASSTDSLGSLQTEQRNPKTERIDKISSLELCSKYHFLIASNSKYSRRYFQKLSMMKMLLFQKPSKPAYRRSQKLSTQLFQESGKEVESCTWEQVPAEGMGLPFGKKIKH